MNTTIIWPDQIHRRWPVRPVVVRAISEGDVHYDWGHIPKVLFARACGRHVDFSRQPSPLMVRHEWWTVRHDLTGEFAYVVRPSLAGQRFAVPVTCYGEELL